MRTRLVPIEPLAKVRIKDRKEVVFDKVHIVCRSAASGAAGSQAVSADIANQRTQPKHPARGGNMCPSDRWPARNQDTAENNEENKNQMEDDCGVSKDTKKHGKYWILS